MLKAKTLDELTITDDFMFGAVMLDPKRCKPLLEMILGVKIDHIEYPELQKTINARYESKSIRLDVYVEDGEGTVYDADTFIRLRSVARDFVVFCVDIARQSGTIMSDVGQFGGAPFAVRAVASRARRPTGRFTPADRKPDAGKAGIIKKKE